MTTPELYNLKRFESAQSKIYTKVVSELKRGKKVSHWMWFIFPQIDGLGSSTTAKFYSIKEINEAKAYLAHPLLSQRLQECTQILLSINGYSALQILGSPDDLKLKSCMTLFAYISKQDSFYHQILKKYYNNISDQKTLVLLKNTSI